jgi:hypothetical protein
MSTKLVELFANWVVERRNMINDNLRGRDCIESVRGRLNSGGVLILSFCLNLSLSCSYELFLGLLCHFA